MDAIHKTHLEYLVLLKRNPTKQKLDDMIKEINLNIEQQIIEISHDIELLLNKYSSDTLNHYLYEFNQGLQDDIDKLKKSIQVKLASMNGGKRKRKSINLRNKRKLKHRKSKKNKNGYRKRH